MSDEMTPNRPYLIRAMHEWICDNGLTTHLAVDARYPGAEVPQEFVQDGQIVLNIAPRAVTAFEAGNEEISFSARFGGVPHTVRVPVEAVMAVFARENGQGMAFEPVEPPPEPPAPGPDGDDDGDKPSRASHLKVVK
ncbi:ClpXP protease specificity-enhancing factor [Alcanivorax marinus]|uniref:ClpXP protease specificity-enhancing factor n=1 Tax=Alloalcanivorax marinus TaxID=1177169 RepID=A0A9Q3YLW6_9GAMM|nr:ClpXP protease specificity-enhancing factor [Alloalcanivorax marinus]MCC4308177.1 ClpXP protease specificity-enhancing factor [Alloalcanivorax marinus]